MSRSQFPARREIRHRWLQPPTVTCTCSVAKQYPSRREIRHRWLPLPKVTCTCGIAEQYPPRRDVRAQWLQVGRAYRPAGVAFTIYFVLMMALTLVPNLGNERMDYIAWRTLQIFANHGMPITLATLERGSNFLMFMPLGIYTVVWFSRYFATSSLPYRILLGSVASLLLSTGIESAQMLIPGRFPDLSDIVMNSTGALTGGLLAALVTIVYRQGKTKRFRLPEVRIQALTNPSMES